MALYGDHVTYDVEAAGGGLIHALRLLAVPADPEVRPVPAVPARGSARGRRHVLERVPRGRRNGLLRPRQIKRESRPLPHIRSPVSVLRAQNDRRMLRSGHQHHRDAETSPQVVDHRQSPQHAKSGLVFNPGDETVTFK